MYSLVGQLHYPCALRYGTLSHHHNVPRNNSKTTYKPHAHVGYLTPNVLSVYAETA
jgi:hypothetical protein